jgi:hypothetical protein
MHKNRRTMLLTDGEIDTAISQNEALASWAGYVLVAGLLLEAALAFNFAINIPIIDAHLSQFANLLVLLGVGGEIHFGAKASRAQKELQRRTDVKLTEALDRAARAQNDLLEFRTPRRALMTAENRARLVERLSPFAGTQFDTALGSGGDQMHFLWDLEETLTAAKWIQLNWGVHAVGVPTYMRNLRPLAGIVMAENVEIQMDPGWRQSNSKAAQALIAALKEIGIAAVEAEPIFPNTNAQAIHILIGPKG